MWLYTYGYLWRQGNGSDGHSHLQNDPTKELQRVKEMSTWALEQIWALEILKMLIMIGCHGVQGLFLFASESTF